MNAWFVKKDETYEKGLNDMKILPKDVFTSEEIDALINELNFDPVSHFDR